MTTLITAAKETNVGYELATIISYPTRASGIIGLLKTLYI